MSPWRPVIGPGYEEPTMSHILVVDDDPAVRATIGIVLEAAGFQVTVTDNGLAGQKAMEAASFDAAVVDVFMPDMDGLEAIKVFRRLNPAMPIIAVSGAMSLFDYCDSTTTPPDYLSMASKLGAETGVQKPFHPRELLQAVYKALGMPPEPAKQARASNASRTPYKVNMII